MIFWVHCLWVEMCVMKMKMKMMANKYYNVYIDCGVVFNQRFVLNLLADLKKKLFIFAGIKAENLMI